MSVMELFAVNMGRGLFERPGWVIRKGDSFFNPPGFGPLATAYFSDDKEEAHMIMDMLIHIDATESERDELRHRVNAAVSVLTTHGSRQSGTMAARALAVLREDPK